MSNFLSSQGARNQPAWPILGVSVPGRVTVGVSSHILVYNLVEAFLGLATAIEIETKTYPLGLTANVHVWKATKCVGFVFTRFDCLFSRLIEQANLCVKMKCN